MQGTAFQGKQLGLAFEVWKRMLGDRCTIMMGMSGAMVPAGMRRLVVRMIEHRLIDCLVSTGANFFHDLHETLGNFHYQGSPAIDDVLLAENLVDRMYDVLADEEKFRQHDQWIGRFAASLDQSRPYTTREFLYLLGLELGKHARKTGSYRRQPKPAFRCIARPSPTAPSASASRPIATRAAIALRST